MTLPAPRLANAPAAHCCFGVAQADNARIAAKNRWTDGG